MRAEIITSRANPLVTHIRKLEKSRAARRESRLFLGDGTKLYEEAVKWNAGVDTVVFTSRHQPPIPAGARAVQVSEALMASLSPARTPQGVLFLCTLPDTALPETLEPGRYLVLDGVQDPGNVGAIWRTADAFGARGLILTGACADPFSPKAVRASMGAAFRLKVWEGTAEETADCLRRSGIPLYGTALRADTEDLRRGCPDPVAVAIGSEGQGMSEALLRRCVRTLRIPMEPRCESLNAAVAAAVVLWELYRGGSV